MITTALVRLAQAGVGPGNGDGGRLGPDGMGPWRGGGGFRIVRDGGHAGHWWAIVIAVVAFTALGLAIWALVRTRRPALMPVNAGMAPTWAASNPAGATYAAPVSEPTAPAGTPVVPPSAPPAPPAAAPPAPPPPAPPEEPTDPAV